MSPCFARMLATGALLAACVVSFHVRAASIEAAKAADGGNTVVISGEMFRGDDERFATVAGGVSGDATVVLTSPGGNLLTGLRIGSAIRMRGWRTAVPDGVMCASACGLVWLGGYQRAVGQGARVGFHAAYIENPDGTKREIGSGNALVGSYLGRLGLTDAAVLYLTPAPPEGAAWLTEATARQIGIRAEFASIAMASLTGTSPASQSPQPVPPAPVPVPPAPVPVRTPDDDRALLRQLYTGFPASVRTKDGQTCVGRECKVRLLGADTWAGRDGAEHRMVVAVAEVKDDCHACSAILGLGLFKRATPSDPWQPEILAPGAERVGGYGVLGGKLTFVPSGLVGTVAMIEDAYGGMGEFGSDVSLWAAPNGAFKKVLAIQLSYSISASCDPKEADCRQRVAEGDYESSFKAAATTDGSIQVDQAFTSAIAIPPARWRIDAGGRALQVAGGKAGSGLTALDRATPENPAYLQGRADRITYEAWFDGIQGDVRAGADFWAGRRSLRVPGTCDPPPGRSPDWTAGCDAARQKLRPLDIRRKADPDYRKGWNSL